MKKMTKFFTLVLMMVAFSAATYAQTATATATATIVTPLTIVNAGTNLSFGNVIPSATLTGTVIVSPASAPTYSNVTASLLPALTATISAAAFTVSGTPAATYAITLPAAPVTITGPGAATMTVDAFTSNPTPTGTLSSPAGTQTLTVGATLHVGIAQAGGTYTSGTPFDVTVNYN